MADEDYEDHSDYGDLQFVDNLKGTYSIMWTIHEFSKLLTRVSFGRSSRIFFLRHNDSAACRVIIYPMGIDDDTSGFVCCALICDKGSTGLTSSFSLLDLTGKKIPFDDRCYDIETIKSNLCYQMISRAELMLHIPNDSLVVTVHGGYSTVRSDKSQEIRTLGEMPPSDYALLYKSGRGADVVIAVGEQEIPVHSKVLEDRAKVLTNTVRLHLTKEHLKYLIPDFTLDIVKRFVQFMYCGTVRIDDLDTACVLVRFGRTYSLEDLKRTCGKYLSDNLDNPNVLRLMIMADANDAAELRSDALEYFATCKKNLDYERYEAELIERPKLVYEMLFKAKGHWSCIHRRHRLAETDSEVI